MNMKEGFGSSQTGQVKEQSLETLATQYNNFVI